MPVGSENSESSSATSTSSKGTASGSVGNALIKQLIFNGSFRPIVTLVRRSQPEQVAMARDADVELRETLVPAMDPAGLETATMEAIRSLEGDVVGVSVLGIASGTAKLTNRRSGYSFGLNPRGVQVDGTWFGDVNYDASWNSVWEGAPSNRSRNGSKRWCSSGDCGNAVRVAKFRGRR